MALHKMVNGKRVDLSPEEEAKVRAEWDANRAKRQEIVAQKRAKLAEHNKNKESAMKKLRALGLEDQEIEALIVRAPRMKEEG